MNRLLLSAFVFLTACAGTVGSTDDTDVVGDTDLATDTDVAKDTDTTVDTDVVADTDLPPADLSDRLVVHLAFDGDLEDSSVNHTALDATTAVASFVADRHGTADAALSTTGCGLYPSVTFDGSAGGFGFSVWLKSDVDLDGGTVARRLIGAQGGGVFAFYYSPGEYYIELYTAGSRTPMYAHAAATETAGAWVHIVVSATPDDTHPRIWRNGVPLTVTGDTIPSLQTATGTFYSACQPYDLVFPGARDDLRLYQRALTDADVAALYAL